MALRKDSDWRHLDEGEPGERPGRNPGRNLASDAEVISGAGTSFVPDPIVRRTGADTEVPRPVPPRGVEDERT